MRPVILLFIFFFLAFLCSALLSYPLFELLNNFFNIRFDKLISHLSTITGLAFIFLYLKYYNVLNLDTAGFAHIRRPVSRDLLHGAIIGIFIIVFLEIILLCLAIRKPAPGLNFSPALLRLIAGAIITGVVVGLIEETLYRGALLGSLLRKSGVLTAVLISSLVYAAVHFIRFQPVTDIPETGWVTGFLVLSGSFDRFLDPAILDSFLSLTAFGIFLALVRLNSGNIYPCIGIHAGVVMSMKIIHELTDYNPDSGLDFLVNSYDHQLGYLALLWLVLLTIIYFMSGNRRFNLLKRPGRPDE